MDNKKNFNAQSEISLKTSLFFDSMKQLIVLFSKIWLAKLIVPRIYPLIMWKKPKSVNLKNSNQQTNKIDIKILPSKWKTACLCHEPKFATCAYKCLLSI